MATHQITLEILDPDQHTGEDTRAELARSLQAEVGAPDEGGLFDLRVEADSREQALERVADALAALGVEQHFTFPSTTGTATGRPATAACRWTSGRPRTSRPTSRAEARMTTSRPRTTRRPGTCPRRYSAGVGGCGSGLIGSSGVSGPFGSG